MILKNTVMSVLLVQLTFNYQTVTVYLSLLSIIFSNWEYEQLNAVEVALSSIKGW